MSNKVQDLVFDYPCQATWKLVLIALANQCDDYGRNCFIGFAKIQLHTGLARRTIFKVMTELESAGLLERVAIGNTQKVEFRLHVEQLRQKDLLGAPHAPVHDMHQCIGSTSAPAAPVHGEGETGAPRAPYKAPKSTHVGAGAHARARDRQDELAKLPKFDAQIIEPFLGQLPPSIRLQVFADFVKHRRAIQRTLSIQSWMQTVEVLRKLAADGVDLNASLEKTMKLSLSVPVDPRERPRGGAPPPGRTRANDDFSSAKYQGTATDELPPELR